MSIKKALTQHKRLIPFSPLSDNTLMGNRLAEVLLNSNLADLFPRFIRAGMT